MHEYDITLKSVLKRLSGGVLRELTGFAVTRWHNVELPAVQNRRVDMLGETADATLVHIELQSTNQAGMALRMLEYASAIHRQFGRFPEQLVLYVGQARLRMPGSLTGPRLDFHYRIVDIRELDGEELIESGSVEDNVIAILARLRDEREAVRTILARIARCARARRAVAFGELTVLAGLRKLEPVIGQEAKQLPILNDIMDHALLGPKLKQGIEIGLEKGREEGREEGERTIILRMIHQRFGPIPAAARRRIEALPASKLEKIATRMFDSRTLEQLLR